MNSHHVLLVDDEEMIRALLKRCLEQVGPSYRVTTAASGPEALTLLQQHSFDLLILDYAMPGMTGLDLARMVRRIWPDLRIMLISGSYAPEIDDAVARLEVDGYLPKPFSPYEFLTSLEQVRQVAPRWRTNGHQAASPA